MTDNPAQEFDQSSQLIDRLAAIESKLDMLLNSNQQACSAGAD